MSNRMDKLSRNPVPGVVDAESGQWLQQQLLPVENEELRVVRGGGVVSVFCRGFCFCTYEMSDRFSRNYTLSQLHVSGGVKLNHLSEVFGLSYRQCRNVLARYKRDGIDGLVERRTIGHSNRRVIDEELCEFILGLRKGGQSFKDISEAVRFRYKKKLKPQSIRAWMCRDNKRRRDSAEEREVSLQREFFGEEQQVSLVEGEWHWNKYAGSLLLYGALEWGGFFKPFEEFIFEEERRKKSSWGIRRVLLTLFFLHALRCKSIEQSKHLVGDDFGEIVGGDFLRLQSLRYGVDGIVKEKGFNRAIEMYFKNIINLVEQGDNILFTDGHFSTYYGKRRIPKGFDPRRQMPYRGRNTIFLHNSQGEVLYLFESAANTTLSNDIEQLMNDVAELGMELKGKTLIFDRGGYSQKCFRYLRKKREMYFVAYLKNRKKEKTLAESDFKTYSIETEDGEHVEYQIYEKEQRETKSGKVRIVVFLANDGRQIPILTNNPDMKVEEIVYLLQSRWREENCFKYMIEHFGIDLLTTYKTDEAPDKVIKRRNPERKKINSEITKRKKELEEFRGKLAQKFLGKSKPSNKAKGCEETIEEFLKQESQLSLEIKKAEVDVEYLKMKRESIPAKIEINLRDDHVIIAQKRRLLINAVKAMNYNAEKWFQIQFKDVHRKVDETLSLVRNLWQQPGEVRNHPHMLELKLQPLDSRVMQRSLDGVLKKLKDNNHLRLPSGKLIKFV